MTVTSGQAGDLFWHIHHDQLAEPLTEPIEKRVRYINTQKPLHERSTRLRWMEPVLTLDDPAVADLYLARADLDRALVVRDEARDVFLERADLDRARDDFRRAWEDYALAPAALEPLHATEHPGCPWDGRTLVFPEVTP